MSEAKKSAAGATALVAALIALGLLVSNQPKPKPKPPTTTSTTTTTTVAPSGGDDTGAFLAAVASGDVVVDRPLRINSVARITTSNRTITFTGAGKLVRTLVDNPTGDLVTFPVLAITADNVTLRNVQIVGPGGVCDVPRPGGGPAFRALYNVRYEESAGITLDGATNVRIEGGNISNVRGDGVRIFFNPRTSPATPSSHVTISDLTTRCVGRAAIANISSSDVTVNRGSYSLSGFWTFNAEPFNTQAVSGYTINQPTIGYATSAWLFAGGGRSPSCNVQMTVNKPTFMELPMSEVVASCVRSTVVVNR
jgi:hypothetical protein